nr:MAG: polyprotein [Xinjiang sediment deltaflexi-like virus 2]
MPRAKPPNIHQLLAATKLLLGLLCILDLPIVIQCWIGYLLIFLSATPFLIVLLDIAVCLPRFCVFSAIILTQNLLGKRWLFQSRPTTPGQCWYNVLSLDNTNFAYPPNCSTRTRMILDFGEVLDEWLSPVQISNIATRHRRWPFVRVLKISRGVYHICPDGSGVGKLRRVHSLPPGWYGAGPDPSFFNETALKNTIVALHAGDYSRQLAETRRNCPHVVPPRMQSYLHSAGIESPTSQATRHPHPVHYAFESRSLRLVGRALNNTPWFALWLKPSKVQYMQGEGCLPPTQYFNPRYVGKDITRYSGSNVPGNVNPISTSPVWFAHDALHHLNPTIVGKWFDMNPTLKYLFATSVIPPETVFDLPTLNPQLYNYSVKGDTLTYIPEGDVGGFYTQPFSARRWLGTNSIISPESRCLHVALLDTNHAHHVFVISREQLLPEKTRVMDLAQVYEIPWYSHPFASQFERLTLGSLCDALSKYDMRVPVTSFRDMYAKIASYASEVYGHYPATYCQAAAHYVAWQRLMRWQYTATWLGHVFMIVTHFTNLPFFGIGWSWQSITSHATSNRFDTPKIWEVDCQRWASGRADTLLPGDDSPLCCTRLGFYELPPNPDKLSQFSLSSATLFIGIVAKISIFVGSGYIGPLLRRFPGLVRFVAYLLDLSWSGTPLGVLLVVLSLWLGYRGPSIYFPYRLPNPIPAFQYALACLFFLPHAKLPFPIGLSWPYMLSLTTTLITFAFPRLHPLVFFLDYVGTVTRPVLRGSDPWPWGPGVPGGHSGPYPISNDTFGVKSMPTASDAHLVKDILDYIRKHGRADNITFTDDPSDGFGVVTRPMSSVFGYWNLVHLVNVLDCVVVLFFLLTSLYRFKPGYTYIHDPETGHSEFMPYQTDPSEPSGSSSSSGPSSGHSGTSDSTTPFFPPGMFSETSHSSPTTSETGDPVAPLEPVRPATPQPIIPIVLPPVNHADPFHAFNLPPAAFDDSMTWANFIERLPVPHNNLDPNTSCVWDCIGATLRVNPQRCWAAYCSQLNPLARAALALGTVDYDILPDVLHYFGLPYTLYLSEVAGGGCPRGMGAGMRAGSYNPASAPITGAGRPGWPTLNGFIERDTNAGVWHLSLRGHADPDANVEPPHPFDPLGWPSTLKSMVEIAELLNVPRKVWGTQYARMLGIQRNPFSTSVGVQVAAQRIRNMVVPAVPLREQVVVYNHNVNDARAACDLATDLHVHPQVLNLRDMDQQSIAKGADLMAKDYLSALNGNVNAMQRRPVNFHLLHGAYGTGKTFELSRLLRAQNAITPYNNATLHFHTWDHDLRDPLRQAMTAAFPNMGLRAANFKTGCMPLGQPMTGTLVLDDAGKAWNGFIPLVLAMNPGLTDIYVTFDVCQAQGVFPTTPSISRKAPATCDWLGNMHPYYATEIRRTSDEVSDLFGLPRAPRIPGQIRPRGRVMVVSNVPPGVPLLAVSPRFAETQNLGGQVCDTFTNCQGHTIHGDVCVDLGGLSATATEKAAWTALTRATGNVYLLLGPLAEKENAVKSCFARSQILSALLTLASVRQEPVLTAALDVDLVVKSAVYNHMAQCLSAPAAALLGLAPATPIVGANKAVAAAYRSSWLHTTVESPDTYTARTHRAVMGVKASRGLAFSRHLTSNTNAPTTVAYEVRHLTALPGDAVLTTPATNYKLPPVPEMLIQPDPALDVNEPTDDALREVVVEANTNSTFQHIVDGPPDALHHVRADKLTTKLGEEKRIRVGQFSKPWSRKDSKRLQQLKRGFAKFFDLSKWSQTGFNPDKFDEATRNKLASWASKRTKRTIRSSVAKQNLESAYNFTSLFPKGQFVKKQPKWRKHAFACQTVSDFNLGKIFRDSDYAVYLEAMSVACAYDSTYMHYRASPDDMSKWYKTFWRPGKMTANDYTAWDSGVDHVFIEFDCWLLTLCGLPQEYIDKFKYDRYNMHSHLGPHMPRQESGDRYTWILNTLRNAALTGASLDCPKRTPLAVSGDDSVTLGAWRRSSGFFASDWIMQPKREEASFTEFCGMSFGGPDVTFDPTVLRWRAAFGMQLGRNDEDYWRSISDAIRETASKLSRPTPMLSNAATLLNRAVYLFDLSPSLLMRSFPTHSPYQPPHKNAFKHSSVSRFFKFMLFL